MKIGFVRNIRGSTAKDQAAELRAFGCGKIYGLERDETFDHALAYFRGTGGTIHVAADLRVLVWDRENKPEQQVYAEVKKAEAAKVRIENIAVQAPHTHTDLMEVARRRLAGDRPFKGDKREPQRRGKKGGKRRAENWLAQHEAEFPVQIARNLVELIGQMLTQKKLAKALGISMSTLRKYYLNKDQ